MSSRFFRMIIFLIFIVFTPCYSQLDFDMHIIDEDLYHPSAPYASDIDGDGDLDIICGTGENTLWWINEGANICTFIYQDELPDNFENPYAITSADLDNDGDMDIAATGITGFDTYIKWWENDGQPVPSFTVHDLDENDENGGMIDVADVDNDGDIDIVSHGFLTEGQETSRVIIVYENLGDGQFLILTFEIDVYPGIGYLVLNDFDNDQDFDIVFECSDNTPGGYRWMENLGDMDFETDVALTDGLYGYPFDIADLDNDDDLDIITTTGPSDDEIFWLENTGLNPPDFEYNFLDWHIDPETIKAGDLDNDGDTDIITAAGDPISGNWGEITYRLNDGEQNFEEFILVESFYGPIGPDCFLVIDLDQDGDLDILATATLFPMLAWFENRLIDAEIEPFHLESPGIGFTTPDTQVVLVWNQAIPNFETNITYYIKCHDNPDNDEIIAETSDTTYVFTGVPGTQYFWDVKAVAHNGLEQWAEEQFWHFTIVDTTNAVDDPLASSIPTEYAIQSVYPNPFNASTTITVALPQPSHLSLQIFNTTGQMVTSLAEGQYGQGYHDFVFNGNGLSSGIYFVHASVPGSMKELRKIVLMK